jgi:hypothetical protein
MSFAAVSEMTVKCEPAVLGAGAGSAVLGDGNGYLLGAGEQQCYAVAGGGFSDPLFSLLHIGLNQIFPFCSC